MRPTKAERVLVAASLFLVMVMLTIGSVQFLLQLETLR
jgi:hypothetical protein